MSALHTALQSLGPADFSSVPTEETETKEYIQQLFAHAQIIIDSVPPPIETPSLPSRSRANTTSSNPPSASDLTASQARSEPIDPANASLQKEWSKPIKLGAKENPLGISVYKLGGKDGRGAWFARRSVHEGMGFRKWKLGLQREFPETMETQGGPGEGNIRGIGGERRVEKIAIEGVGNIEVYHLSAQFPGPTAPRDFVTMLVTSSTAIDAPNPSQTDPMATKGARHFMVVSKPCIHPECPPRDGFIRGQYESVEFIREIPVKPTKSSSTTDLLQMRRRSLAESREPAVEEAGLVHSAQQTLNRGGSGDEMLASMDMGSHAPLAKEILVQEGRKRGKTISFAESRGIRAKGEALDTPHDETSDPAEHNPVEWVMITRSDPGGSVPRFLVERGTPSGIVSDASKFIDWACKKEHPVKDDYGEKASEVDQEIARKNSHAEALEQYQTNGHLAGLEGVPESVESSMTLTNENTAKDNSLSPEPVAQESYVSTLTNAAVAGFEAYAPQSVLDRVHGHQSELTDPFSIPDNDTTVTFNASEDTNAEAVPRASTSDSFATAEDYLDDANSTSSKSMTPNAKPSPAQERELAKFQQRKKTLDEKLAQTKEKEGKDAELLTSKEEDRIRKAEEKHAREVAKQEQRYQKEVAKIESKRVKEEQKAEERKKKAEEKDEKVKLTRERDAARSEVDNLKRERELLKEQVGALQRENTALVAKVGKLEVGKKVLGEVQAEIESAGRSRSSSLRGKKGVSSSEGGLEATVLAGGKAI